MTPGLVGEARDQAVENGQLHARRCAQTQQRSDGFGPHGGQIRKIHDHGAPTDRARSLSAEEEMHAFDLSIRRKNEFAAWARSQNGGIVADAHHPRLGWQLARTSCDPLNQCGLSEIGQGALKAGHPASVERVGQSRFDAWAGFDRLGDDALAALRGALGFQPMALTSA